MIVGTRNISPQHRLEFHSLKGENDREIRAFFVQFAREKNFALEDAGSRMPPKSGERVFFLALRKGSSIEIIVTRLKADHFFVATYELHSDPNFADISSALVEQLKRKWSNTKPYTGP